MSTFTLMQKHIVVTGPESAGKTTLSRKIAESLDAIWIPEYARGYLEAAGRKAHKEDFPHFVRATQQLIEAGFKQQERRNPKSAIVVQDTSFEILRIWQADKFKLSPIVEEVFQTFLPDAYILCSPDLHWRPDPLREDPNRRQELYITIRELIKKSSVPVLEVSGFGESRTKNALMQLEHILG